MAFDGSVPMRRMQVAELVPAGYNPRDIDPVAFHALQKSLERFNLVQPIVWNQRTGNVVGGHKRLRILTAAGVAETDVVVGDWSDEEEKALNLALNNQAIQGFFTAEAETILEELKTALPDAYDELLLFKIHPDAEAALVDVDERNAAKKKDQGEFDLSPEPYESYNYVVLLFRNEIDWAAAVDHFGLKRVEAVPQKRTVHRKIGMGQVIEGAPYLAKVRPTTPADQK